MWGTSEPLRGLSAPGAPEYIYIYIYIYICMYVCMFFFFWPRGSFQQEFRQFYSGGGQGILQRLWVDWPLTHSVTHGRTWTQDLRLLSSRSNHWAMRATIYMYVCISIYMYIYIYIYMYVGEGAPPSAGSQPLSIYQTTGTGDWKPLKSTFNMCLWLAHYRTLVTPNLPTDIVDFGGLDSSIILISRGGISRHIGDFPESLSQAMLVGTMLVGRLGVYNCSGGGRSPLRGLSRPLRAPESEYVITQFRINKPYNELYIYIYIHT